jgi:hypothetical protein
METTKAIRPDIVDLFDVIRTQAQEYTHAFEVITLQAQDAALQRDAVQKAMKQFQSRHDGAIAELTGMINANLQTFEEKTHYVKKVYSELAQIQALRSSLEELRATFGRHNSKLEAATRDLHKIIERNVTEEFGKLERKVAHRLNKNQEDILNLDMRMQAMHDYQRRELTTIGEDVDDFKSKITETKYIVDETQKIIELSITRAETELQDKIDEMEMLLESQRKSSPADSTIKSERPVSDQSEIISTINAKYDKRIKQLEKKLSTIVNIVAFAATIFLILFALVAFQII